MPVLPLPNYTPEFPITKSVKPRQRSAQLPSWGIEQRATSGLNQTAPEWNPRWVLSTADADILDAFLEARASSGNEWIQWTDPDGNPGLFRCDDWTKQLIACEISEVQATFRRVFDISVVVVFDPDAAAYIAAVEAADGQPLEPAVKTAINSFVVGCKADGIWAAIKAACILAGARTLSGALVPLVGTAPSSYYFTGTDTDANYSSTSLLLKFPGVNGSTSFVDESFIGISVTLSGTAATVSTAQKKFLPTSGFFSGGAGYILLGSNAALAMDTGDFTIESWVYKTNSNFAGITAATSYNSAASLRISGAAVTLDRQGQDSISFSGATLPLNTWYHIAVTRSSGSARCFINGVQYGTTQTYNVNFSGQINAIGRLAADNTGSFTGYLSDLRITKGVARYTSAFTPPSRPFGTSATVDYNRKTGLVGDGSTKYLNSNRNNNADPQNSKHLAVGVSTSGTVANTTYIGQALATGSSHLSNNNTIPFTDYAGRVNGPGVPAIGSLGTGLVGLNRSTSTGFVIRSSGTTSSELASISATPASGSILIFDGINKSNARLAFYSIGESLNLALLDARVTALINAIAAAIP